MILRILEPYKYTYTYQGVHIFYLVTKWFQFRWFTEREKWFIYIHVGKRWWKFSNKKLSREE